MKQLSHLVGQIRDLIDLSSIEAAEIYADVQHHFELQVKDQVVDNLEQSDEVGVAVRLERDGKIGFAYTTDLAPAELEKMIQHSYNSLNTVEPKEPQILPRAESVNLPKQLDQFDSSLASRPTSEKIDKAMSLESTARHYDQRVKKVRMASYNEQHQEVFLWNSRIGEHSFQRTLCQVNLMVMAGDETDQEAAWNIGFSPFFDKLDSEPIAREAAEEAVGRLGAGSLETGHYPAVLDRGVVAAFLGILAPSFLAESVRKKKSRLAGRINDAIYAESVSLIDDGLYPGGVATAPVDGEGMPSQTSILVADGVLKTYLYDSSNGQLNKKESTGNSVRSNFKEAPRTGTRNFYLKPGHLQKQDLYAELGDGIAIQDVIGMHTANPITGDFSVGASGYRIHGGKRGGPIRGFAISGNLHHVLSSVQSVGSDLKFYGPVGAPSVCISSIDVGGT